MPYRPLDHTADIGVELEAPSREALFEEALQAFTDAVTVLETVEPAAGRRIELAAETPEDLLVLFLEELLYLFEVDGLLFRRAHVEITEITEAGEGLSLAAVLEGEPYEPAKHPIKVLVKGVTYHRLAAEPRGGGWYGRVIFDI